MTWLQKMQELFDGRQTQIDRLHARIGEMDAEYGELLSAHHEVIAERDAARNAYVTAVEHGEEVQRDMRESFAALKVERDEAQARLNEAHERLGAWEDWARQSVAAAEEANPGEADAESDD